MSFVYKVVRPGPDPAAIIAAVSDTLDTLDDLEIDDAVPDLRTKLAHAAALHAALRDGAVRYQQIMDTTVRALADRTVDLDTALTAVVTAHRAAETDIGGALLNRAGRMAATDLWRAAVDYGDRFVVDLLGPVVDTAVATITTVASTLPPAVFNDATAVAAGPKIAEQWRRLTVAHTRWGAAHQLADRLRAQGVLSVPGGVVTHTAPSPAVGTLLPPAIFRFARPDLATPPGPRRDPALALADDATAGAGPGLYTGPDIDLAQLDREAAETQPVAAR